MRMGIALFVVASMAPTGCGQVAQVKGQAPASAGGADAFGGIWIPQSSVFDGKEQLPAKADRDLIRLSVENGDFKLFVLTDPVKLIGQRVSTAGLTVDEKAETFELTIKDGIKKGTKLHGIYEFGKTSMKLCYGPADKPRPTKFEAPAGGTAFYDVYERYKK